MPGLPRSHFDAAGGMTPHQGSIAIYDDPKQLLDRLGQSPFYTETS